MKDLHLSMKALYSPNGYDLSLMEFCLPFYFKIKGENQEKIPVYYQETDIVFQDNQQLLASCKDIPRQCRPG